VSLAGVDLHVEHIDASFAPTWGRVSMDVPLTVGLGVASVRRTVRATLSANALDTANPTMEASIGTPL
jgi:hypothetical protein